MTYIDIRTLSSDGKRLSMSTSFDFKPVTFPGALQSLRCPPVGNEALGTRLARVDLNRRN